MGVSLAAAAFSNPQIVMAAEKPDSKFRGVQIGVIVPYSYHFMANDAKSILADVVSNNINAVEMMNPAPEEWAGAPKAATPSGGAGGGYIQRSAAPGSGMNPPIGPRRQPTPEQVAAQKERATQLSAWRASVPMSKYVEFRKWYADAGVRMYGFKLGLPMNSPESDFDYAFNVTKALGANQLTMEMPEEAELTEKIGHFAEKHKIMVGYHAHLQATPQTWDEAMRQSKWNGINLDLGHYVAAGNKDALQFIRAHHDRITSMHLKDRKSAANGGSNMVWGQGDTPIKEALRLVRDEKYSFPCTIELEYAPLEGSDSAKEVMRCLAFCKAALEV
jgi:sugar phosphate isomerase/epimerase